MPGSSTWLAKHGRQGTWSARRQRSGSAVLFGLPGLDDNIVDVRGREQMRKLQLQLNPDVIDELSPRPPSGKPKGADLSPGLLRRTTSSSFSLLRSDSLASTVVFEESEEELEEAEEIEKESQEAGAHEELLAFLAHSTTQQRRSSPRTRRTLPLLSQDTASAGLKLAVKRSAAVEKGVAVDTLDAAVASAAAEAAPELTQTRSIEFSNGATYIGPGAVRLGIWYPHGRGELVLPVFAGLGLNSGAYARGVVYTGTYDWGQRAQHGMLRYPSADARTRAQFQTLWDELEQATISDLRKRILDMGISTDDLRAATESGDNPRLQMISLALNFVSDVYRGRVEPAGENTDVETNAHQSQIFEVVKSGQPSPPPPPKLQRHGEGEMWWGGVSEAAWTAHYVGAFVRDRRHGSGVMRWRGNTTSRSELVPTEYTYEGEWRDGKPCGKGTMTKRWQTRVSMAEDQAGAAQHEEKKLWEESIAVGEWREGVPVKGAIKEQIYPPRLAKGEGWATFAARNIEGADSAHPPVLSPASYEGAWGNTKAWRGALARFKSAGRKAMSLGELTPLQHAKRVAGKQVWRLFTPEEKSMALARSLEIIELAEDEGEENVYWDEDEAEAGSIAEADHWWPRRNGKGLRKLPDGGSYTGFWAADLPHGEGKHTRADGTVIWGKLWNAARPGVITGHAMVRYARGGRYEGEWDGRYGRHGNGLMRYPKSSTDVAKELAAAAAAHVEEIEGKWIEDKIGGEGRLRYVDGSEYTGAISNGWPSGEGAMTYSLGTRSHALTQAGRAGDSTHLLHEADGHFSRSEQERPTTAEPSHGPIIVRFEGEWLNGWRVHGVCEYSSNAVVQEIAAEEGGGAAIGGDAKDAISSAVDADWAGWLRYTGCIEHSKEHGHGIVEYFDGRYFEGQFECGRRLDYRCLPNESRDKGRDGETTSEVAVEGRMTYPGGHVYIGHFVNGMRHGSGTMWYPDKHGILRNVQASLPSDAGVPRNVVASDRVNRSVSSVLYQAALLLEGIAGALNARTQEQPCGEMDPSSSPLSDREQMGRNEMQLIVGIQKRTTSFMRRTQAPPPSPTAADGELQLRRSEVAGRRAADKTAAGDDTVLDVDTEKDCCFEGEWLYDQRTTGRLASNFPETDYDIAPSSLAAVGEIPSRKLHKGGQLLSKQDARRSQVLAWQRKGPCRYVGQWCRERPHGTGVMRWWSYGKQANGTAAAGGETYTGEWHAGARQGTGTAVKGQSVVYVGTWAKDRYDGAGDLLEIYACSRYKGEFRKGLKHGAGVERQDGAGGELRGTWERGLMHGPGVYRYSDGSEWARRYSHGELLTDELIGGPNQMVDGLNHEDTGAISMEEGWRTQVQPGNEFDPALFQTPRVDYEQALCYADRMAKLRARHRAVLLSAEVRVAQELKKQRSGFNRRQRTKVLLVVAMRRAMLMARQHAMASDAATQKEADSLRRNQLRTMPFVTAVDDEAGVDESQQW